MKGFIRLMIISALVGSLVSCASQQTDEDDSLTTESYSEGGATTSEATSQDDFADFDSESGVDSSQASQPPPAGPADADLALEDEMKQSNADQAFAPDDLDSNNQQAQQAPPPEPMVEEPLPEQPLAQEPPPPVVEEPPAPTIVDEPAPMPEEPALVASSERPVEITGLKYKANDNGGTVIVESNGPVNYTTRANDDLKQYIVEIQNSVLPKRLKRTLNTKDIKGAVGAVDAYQSPGSKTSRIVVQMRDGFGEPVVQQEGNSLLIVTSAQGAESVASQQDAGGGESLEDYSAEAAVADRDGNIDLNNNKILASQSLDEFLSGNTKFYGKKISIETSNIDVRDALKFITEESGVNMVITEEVKGNIALKLRQVPWDQALVVIMKARKLGYSRQGNVLRIVPIEDLKKEEDDATKLAIARKVIEPLKVRAFNISYAKVDELDKKIKEFLTERGKVVSDIRTNSIVVTDVEDSINRVVKLIQGLDTAPPQVLIEGKIVEASDSFQRNVGIQWGFNGGEIKIGDGKNGPINLRPNLSVGKLKGVPGGMNLSLTAGVLDIFGNLDASLELFEQEDKVKVLSSPRIVTLSNEKADISQTNELPVRTLSPQPNGPPIVTFQFKPLTLKLEVTPQVTAEGTVIMKVSVNRQIKGAAASAADDVFSVNSREANTRVIVKNGQTAVIGGIYRSDLTESVTGMPWLKDIPVLGALFRGRSTDNQRSELLIFLTPRILAQAETTGSAGGGE